MDAWFKAFHKAKEMCGGSTTERRILPKKEIEYLDALVRGVYAKRELESGYVFGKHSFEDDFYMAIPLHKGQLSVREVMNGEKLTRSISTDEPLTVDHVDGPYATNADLRQLIVDRGL